MNPTADYDLPDYYYYLTSISRHYLKPASSDVTLIILKRS